MILNCYGGIIPPGTYDIIIARGQTQIGTMADFATLVVKSEVEVNRGDAGDVIFRGGSLRCPGSLRCGRITGYGKLSVHGSLKCASLADFTGIIEADAIDCDTSLAVRGSLESDSVLVHETITVTGHVSTQYLEAEHVTLSALQTTMLPRFGMHDYAQRSTVSTIKADTVRMQTTTCQTIYAGAATLEKGAYAKRVYYRHTLSYDSSSYAAIIRREYRKSRSADIRSPRGDPRPRTTRTEHKPEGRGDNPNAHQSFLESRVAEA